MIYIASPYSHPDPTVMQRRFEEVERFTAWCLKRDLIAISPIVYGHEMAKKHELPTDAAWWARFNHRLFNQCTLMYLLQLPGWRESKGVALELEWAKESFHAVVRWRPTETDFVQCGG